MLPWIWALLTAASAIQAPPPAPPAGPFIARTWGTADGLPQNSVTSIVQTRDGYLWLGTFGGLVRFDGQAFTVFTPDNTSGLGSARIVELLEDRKGVLWIGTETGLTKYDAGRFSTYTTRDGLPDDEIITLRDDRQGRLWIATGGGVARFDGRSFERVSLGGLVGTVQAIGESPDGDIWAGTEFGLGRFHGDNPPSIVTREGSSEVLVDSRGHVWTGRSKLTRWERVPGSEEWRSVNVPLPEPSKNAFLSVLAEDRDGNLWIGTNPGGLYRWREGGAVEQAMAGFTKDIVRAIEGDRDGNLWVGTDLNGLQRLKRRRVFSYQRPDGPSGQQSIGPIVGDGADGLWIGATCGGLLHFRAGAFETFEGQGATPDCVWALLRDPDGSVWMGAASRPGLSRLEHGRITGFSHPDGLQRNLVTALARDRDGRLWVGSYAGLSTFENGRFTTYGRDAGLNKRVLTIFQDRAGTLWIGTVGGLFRFANHQFTSYMQAQGLSHDAVRAIHEDADGVLWIGTYGGGLNRFKDGRFTSYGPRQGLPDVAVSRIIEDARGHFWMSGNKGVFRVARSQLNDVAEGRASYITGVLYGTADGMVTDETNGGSPAGWKTDDGRLWFPTIRGLIGIDPVTESLPPPPVYVERTIVAGQSMDVEALARLGPGSADAEFHYTAIDLTSAEKTRFRYRLDGYDHEWIDAGTRRVAYYTGIRPGRYTFQVMATDGDGGWGSSPARVSVVVVPFWWQRSETTVVGLLFVIAVTGFVVRHVTLRRARARVAELEREQALERERARIARDLHDDLGSRLTHIAMLADSAASVSVVPRIATAARDAASTMRELVWSVNARNDTVESFASYFALFAEEHIIAAGIRCRILLPPDLPARPLVADVRRHLYLACKEAVNNAVKHAQAKEIRVSFRVDGTHFIVEIADDGRGLPADMDPRGNGLKNYRERMDAASGSLEMASTPQTGTCVTFTVNL
jgi:ligand-binding sensor domain-containing protein/signal transduction histidine kinase